MNIIAKKRKRTLYKPAKHKKYAKIVSFKNPTQARKSTSELTKEFNTAKTNAKRLRVTRVTQYASNRAKATLERKKLSIKTRKRLRQIADIYGRKAKQFWNKYKKLK